MNLAQLKRLVKQGESEYLEFKNSTASLTTGLQTVCAFLNSKIGGAIIFGVTDSGKIIGQHVSDKTRKEIALETSKIEPFAKINIIYVPVGEDKQVIIFDVVTGENAPYTYEGRAFIRNQSTTMRMTKEEYIHIHTQNNQTLWEKLTSNRCKIIDLDKNRIKEVIRMAVYEKRLPEDALSATIPTILKKLDLMVDEKITNAAIILFCKNEDKIFMQSNLKVARFKGIDKTEFLDNKTFKANVFDLYDKAMDFLTAWLPVAARIEPGNPVRVETPAIPYKVLREAVVNALIHRDYSNEGGSISIAIYDDRVNITNIGSLPKGIMLNQLSKEHASIQRNPRIAHVFYLCGKIERWGRGTVNMIQDCKSVGNPIPHYEEVGGGFSITLPLKEPLHTINIKKEPMRTIKLTDRQKKIIEILQQEPRNTTQIIDQMDTKITNRTMQLELAKLKKMNLIKSSSKTKSNLWTLSE